MKNLLFLLFGLIFYHYSYSQTYNCSPTIFTVSNIICDEKGNDDPADDMINFTVSGENGRSSEAICGWDELPMILNASPYDNVDFDEENSRVNFWYGSTAYNVTFAVNAPGCLPLFLTVKMENCPERNLALNPNNIAIPTLGQWGLIVLSMLILILGLNKIRNTNDVVVSI